MAEKKYKTPKCGGILGYEKDSDGYCSYDCGGDGGAVTEDAMNGGEDFLVCHADRSDTGERIYKCVSSGTYDDCRRWIDGTERQNPALRGRYVIIPASEAREKRVYNVNESKGLFTLPVSRSEVRAIVAECINQMAAVSEELEDPKFPEALEPELLELYDRFRESEDIAEKQSLVHEICRIIDDRWKD